MACNLNLFSHPELLDGAKELQKVLETQIRLVKDFEVARHLLSGERLHKTKITPRCRALIDLLETSEPDSNLSREISKLSIEELLFTSICFTEKSLNAIHEAFPALGVTQYMRSQRLEIGNHRKKITDWLKEYSRPDGRFREIFDSIIDKEPTVPTPIPQTGAEDDLDSFTFDFAESNNVAVVFSKPVADSLSQRQQGLGGMVRSRVPRNYLGDGIISLEVTEAPWLHEVFQGTGLGANVPAIRKFFRGAMDEIDRCELRAWEKQNGFDEWTNCAKLQYVVKLRVANVGGLMNSLHDPNATRGYP